jgi:hypothetical protein
MGEKGAVIVVADDRMVLFFAVYPSAGMIVIYYALFR